VILDRDEVRKPVSSFFLLKRKLCYQTVAPEKEEKEAGRDLLERAFWEIDLSLFQEGGEDDGVRQ